MQIMQLQVCVNGRVGRFLWVPEDLKASPRLLTHTTRSRRSNMILAVIANSGYTTERSGADIDYKWLEHVIAGRVRTLSARDNVHHR
jgi:hypothetical protein